MTIHTRCQRIIVELSPDHLVNDRDVVEEDLDHEATVCEYAVSLGLYLADNFDALSVEVTPVPGLAQTRIHVKADSGDPRTARQLRAEVRAAIDEHYERGDFWVEQE